VDGEVEVGTSWDTVDGDVGASGCVASGVAVIAGNLAVRHVVHGELVAKVITEIKGDGDGLSCARWNRDRVGNVGGCINGGLVGGTNGGDVGGEAGAAEATSGGASISYFDVDVSVGGTRGDLDEDWEGTDSWVGSGVASAPGGVRVEGWEVESDGGARGGDVEGGDVLGEGDPVSEVFVVSWGGWHGVGEGVAGGGDGAWCDEWDNVGLYRGCGGGGLVIITGGADVEGSGGFVEVWYVVVAWGVNTSADRVSVAGAGLGAVAGVLSVVSVGKWETIDQQGGVEPGRSCWAGNIDGDGGGSDWVVELGVCANVWVEVQSDCGLSAGSQSQNRRSVELLFLSTA